VQDRHCGVFPRDPHSIRDLPGVGRYTANAVATFAFDQSVPVVEANISRLLARVLNIAIPIDSVRGRDKLWAAAGSLVPKENPGHFNSALMDLGALICLPRNPKCGICPVRKFCRAPDPKLLPRKRPRLKTRRLIEDHAFTVRRGEILLEQAAKRWRGMWMLPPTETNRTDRPIHRSIFPFTHHRVTLRLFRRHTRKIDRQTQRWVAIADLPSIPMPSPHRRAIEQRLGFDLAATPPDLKNRS
jgi:A/G-specific adenine glycosylase